MLLGIILLRYVAIAGCLETEKTHKIEEKKTPWPNPSECGLEARDGMTDSIYIYIKKSTIDSHFARLSCLVLGSHVYEAP